MFRELLSFCVDFIEANGSYSLRLTQYANETRFFVHFWARNSFDGLCIGVFPGRVYTPETLLLLLSNFFALIGKDAHLLFIAGFAPRIVWTVSRVLSQHRKICRIPSFNAEDLEQTMLVPSVQILDRFDFRSVLDFLLLRLRSACSSPWCHHCPIFNTLESPCFTFYNFFFI